MSELSPQAQAVLDAYRSSHLSIDNLAAALRAVAAMLRDAYANEEYVDPADDWLDDIAAELEAQ